MTTPSRATVITATVAIGVFGAGTGLGTIISAGSQAEETQVARLAAGTYRLDDQTETWTSRSPTDKTPPASLSGADGGSMITTGSGEQRVCLTTTTDGQAVEARGTNCTPLPVLATGSTPALRPGNPRSSPTTQPRSSSPEKESPEKKSPEKKDSPAKETTAPPAARSTPTSDPKPRSTASSAPRATPSSTISAALSPAPSPDTTLRVTPTPTQSVPGVTPTPTPSPRGVAPTPTTSSPVVTPTPTASPLGVSPTPTHTPRGKVLSTLPDGSRLVQRADGSRAIWAPDGQLVRVFPGPWANVTKVLPDGNWLMLRPNGDRMIITPKGVEIAPRDGRSPSAEPTPTESAPPVADGNVLRPPGDASLPVFQDQELLQRAYEALALNDGMRYTDANGNWDLNIAPPGTPECRNYSAAELRRLSAAQSVGGAQAAIPRDSCALPAFVRWLYADPAPGQVSNWTKFTGLPERNLDLVVTNPEPMPPAQTGPGLVEPDQGGYSGS